MRLLILTKDFSRASFRLRIENHLGLLKSKGIDCDVAVLPKSVLQRYRLFRSACTYDGVLLQKAMRTRGFSAYDILILRRYSKKLIFDFDDAIMYRRSNPNKLCRRRLRIFERIMDRADTVIAGNDYLANIAKQYCKHVQVLPTGLDTDAYRRVRANRNHGEIRLVWIGSNSTLHHLRYIKPALESLGAKYKNLVLYIIADKFFDLEHMPVRKIQWCNKTEVSALLQCDIGLAPLIDDRYSRGKCGFKILQYFASGLPVIASDVGFNSKLLEESNGGLLVKNYEDWEKTIDKAINNFEKVRELGVNGKDYVKAYHKTNIGKHLYIILKDAIEMGK